MAVSGQLCGGPAAAAAAATARRGRPGEGRPAQRGAASARLVSMLAGSSYSKLKSHLTGPGGAASDSDQRDSDLPVSPPSPGASLVLKQAARVCPHTEVCQCQCPLFFDRAILPWRATAGFFPPRVLGARTARRWHSLTAWYSASPSLPVSVPRRPRRARPGRSQVFRFF